MTETRGKFLGPMRRTAAISALILQGLMAAAIAQTLPPPIPQSPPSQIPDKIGPPIDAPPAPDDSKHEKLKRENGVIKPPKNVDPEMTLTPPDTGARTPVIPPPGTPGGGESIQPK